MNMSEAIKSVFSKYATFSGRARRSEYWYFQLFVWLVNMVFAVLLRNLHPGSSLYRLISGLDGLFSLVIFVPSLAVTWRRFHDIGKSGAICLLGYGMAIGSIVFVAVMAVTYSFSGSYASSQSALASMGLFILLLFLALVVVAVLMLVWLCRAGQAGANRFGPDPKAPVGYSRDFDDFQDDEDAPWHY